VIACGATAATEAGALAEHRHPHAPKFRTILEGLRRLAVGLDDPTNRNPRLGEMQAGLIQILKSQPAPSLALCRELYALQADLALLFRSREPEYALLAQVDLGIVASWRLADDPPEGFR
jgi:hypothetical protein